MRLFVYPNFKRVYLSDEGDSFGKQFIFAGGQLLLSRNVRLDDLLQTNDPPTANHLLPNTEPEALGSVFVHRKHHNDNRLLNHPLLHVRGH